MNFFEFYQLPVHLKIDQSSVKQKFIEYSRKFHPDLYTLSDPDEQEHNLELSTLNNEAYKTLSNEQLLIPYVLKLNGLLGGEGKDEMPQEFLMEMMDINEKLMELEFDDDPALRKELTAEVKSIENTLVSELDSLKEKHDNSEEKNELLEKIKTTYLKLKYIYRLKESLNRN